MLHEVGLKTYSVRAVAVFILLGALVAPLAAASRPAHAAERPVRGKRVVLSRG